MTSPNRLRTNDLNSESRMNTSSFFRYMVTLALTAAALLPGGCSKKDTLESKLVGRWVNVSLHVTVNTYRNTDSTLVMDFTEEDLQTRFPTKPAVTTLNEDGTYFTEYRAQSDSLLARPTGEWSVKDDTLTFRQLTPNEFLYLYHIRLVGDRMELRTMTDYDNDGKFDDEVVSVAKKIEER